MNEKTIAAIATAQGAGGIGIIRISGCDALEISQKVFKSITGRNISEMKGYTAAYGHIYDGDELIDSGVLLVYLAPHSYTGENVAEISCHGGLYVTKRVLRAVLNAGASMAEAGEFTKRAFLNGKIGLTEAEGVMDIISARGEQSSRAALGAMDGALRKKIDSVKESLITSAAHLSAWADYPEDDIPAVSTENLTGELKSSIGILDKLLATYDAGKAIREGIDTVIAGKPNVGKSTLMNLLSGYERSIVTDIPGTTRDVIEDTVMLGDIPLCLSDTAGIRATDDPVESIGVEKARKRVKSAGLVLAVFDSSKELCDDDRELIELIKDCPSVAVINKSDLKTAIDMDYIEKNVRNVVFISAKSGSGASELEKVVSDIIGTSQLDPSAAIIANERQRDCAKRARDFLNEAINALEMGITLDAVTVIIEDAISALLELTGERASEAVVDSVFSHFCVGK